MAKIYKGGRWSSDRRPQGMSQDEWDQFVDNQRDAAVGRKSDWASPGRTIRPEHHKIHAFVGTTEENFRTLLEYAESHCDPVKWCQVGQAYLNGGQGCGGRDLERARFWLEKAAQYNEPDAVELLKSLDAPAKPTVAAKEKTVPRPERHGTGLPRVISTMVDIGAVKHGVAKYIVLVLAEGESRFRPAVAVAHKYGVWAQNYYDSEDLALNAATKIRQEWGR